MDPVCLVTDFEITHTSIKGQRQFHEDRVEIHLASSNPPPYSQVSEWRHHHQSHVSSEERKTGQATWMPSKEDGINPKAVVISTTVTIPLDTLFIRGGNKNYGE